MCTIHSIANQLIDELGYKRISSIKFDEDKLYNIDAFINAYELLDIGDDYTLEITCSSGGYQSSLRHREKEKSLISMANIKTTMDLIAKILNNYSLRKNCPDIVRKISKIISILPIFTNGSNIHNTVGTRANGLFIIGFGEYIIDTTEYDENGHYIAGQKSSDNPNHMLIIRKVIKHEQNSMHPPPYYLEVSLQNEIYNIPHKLYESLKNSALAQKLHSNSLTVNILLIIILIIIIKFF